MPKKPDAQMQSFQTDLLEAVRDMKANRAARITHARPASAERARSALPQPTLESATTRDAAAPMPTLNGRH